LSHSIKINLAHRNHRPFFALAEESIIEKTHSSENLPYPLFTKKRNSSLSEREGGREEFSPQCPIQYGPISKMKQHLHLSVPYRKLKKASLKHHCYSSLLQGVEFKNLEEPAKMKP
jgi:hypothetical protein